MVIEVVEKVIRVYEINCASVEEAKERALQCHKLINRKKAKKTKVIEAIVIDESNERIYKKINRLRKKSK